MLSDAFESAPVGDRIMLFIESVWVTMRVIIVKEKDNRATDKS